jgi:hypothetical protein
MYLSENIQEKWGPVMDHKNLPEIKDSYRRDVTLRLLENQENFLKEAAPTNSMGASSSTAGAGPIDTWDPILISLVRRAMPQMIAYDVTGVQPMTGPTGLIFAMKSQYVRNNAKDDGSKAMFDEADASHSGRTGGTSNATSAQTGLSGSVNPFTAPANTVNGGMLTSTAETLGDGAATHFAEMAFTIDKISVTAKSRALKAEYSTELAQDLKAVHGLDAETELANILSTEILQEINREVIRTIYSIAKQGAKINTAVPGTFNLDTDSNGRWSVEKFKGLMFQIERDRNEIGHETRRGKANFMICSADVASAMSMAGMLESGHALNTDDTMSTFAGTMNGLKVYVDPYYTSGVGQFYCLGYKGSSPYDAGMFYCPYVPLQMVRAMGENTFQPKIGFKTRYGMVANPFVNATGALTAQTNATDGNQYYRKVVISNLM